MEISLPNGYFVDGRHVARSVRSRLQRTFSGHAANGRSQSVLLKNPMAIYS